MRETAIVVGADGSASGAALVRQSAVLAASSGAALHIVAPGGALEKVARSVIDSGVRIEAHKAVCDIRAAALKVAKEVDAELIVIERPARSRLRRALRAAHRRLVPHACVHAELIEARAVRGSDRMFS